MGDGILVEFHNVVDALRCAVEVQEQKDNRNADLRPEHRLDFRIGIHTGDIIVEGDDITATASTSRIGCRYYQSKVTSATSFL